MQVRLYGIGSNQLPPHVGENLADMLAQVSASVAAKLGHLLSAQFASSGCTDALLVVHWVSILLTLNYSADLDLTTICFPKLEPAIFCF